MSTSSATQRTIVVDASLAIWAVLPIVATVDTLVLFEEWYSQNALIVAPTLWLAECTSAIRAIVASGQIGDTDGRRAVNDVLALDVDLVPMTGALSLAAYDWATRLGQRRAYDGFYVALADQIDGEFWTADERLVNSLTRLEVSWAFSVSNR